jgi:predicted phage terminase large subunit-like protein
VIPWRHRVELYPKQRAAIQDPERHAIIEASPKAGKTVGCLQWVIEETANVSSHIDHPRFLWIAPVLGQAEIAFMRAYQEVLKVDEVELHKTNRTITLPDGAVLVFRSAERPDLIYGEDYHGIVIDEASDMKEDAWRAAISTSNHTRARFRIITNVRNRRNWAYRHARRVQKGELGGWEYHMLTQADAVEAGIVEEATDTDIRSWLDESVYRMVYYNEVGDDGSIQIDTAKLTEGGSQTVPESVTRCRAWDFAATETGDWTVGALLAANHEGFWVENIVRERVGAEMVIDLIRQTAATDGPYVDQVVEEEKGASGKLFLETIRQQLYQVPTAGSVWPAGVEQNKLVRAWPMVVEIGQGIWHLAEGFNASELLAELEQWPDSRYDDQVDALAHARNYLAPMVQGMVGSGWRPGQAAS